MIKRITKENLIKLLMIVTSILFAIPSIVYIIKNRTIYKFYWVWTYFFRYPKSNIEQILNTTMVLLLFSILFILYICIIKNHKKMFKNNKQIMKFILIISIIFLMIIPYTSTDVYSYIANGWSNSHYGENPYYTSIQQMEEERNIRDQMFSKVAKCWRNETVVYGPLWTLFCNILTSLSLGNIDLALIVFKLANLLVHLVNSFIIFKITKKRIFVLLYGLNPFILFEALSNVHNDIFIVLFILLAIYFIYKKKNVFLSVACIAMASAIKYFTILLLPFLVLYYVSDKKISTKIKYCIICGIEFIVILLMFYLVYIQDLNVFAGLFIQQNKYNRSIMLIVQSIFGGNIGNIIKNIVFMIFVVYYIVICILMLLTNKKSIKYYIQKYQIILFIFTFILITNFNPWYIMWLFPTMIFLKGKQINNIINLSYSCQIANCCSFLLYNEDQILGIPYFIIMIVLTMVLTLIKQNKNILIKEK